MSVSKRCEVCGGLVRPLEGQQTFGSCERCGIVYSLVKREADQSEVQEPFLGADTDAEREAQDEGGATSESSKVRWQCPDCGELLSSTSDGDLKFLVREHIREYHPNRAS